MSHLFLTARLVLIVIALGLGSTASAQGEDTEAVAMRDLNAAVEAREGGRAEEAAEMLSGLLDSLESASRPASPALLSDVLFHYAEALRLAGDAEAAEAAARRALDIDMRRLPADSPDLASVRSVLGAALRGQGRVTEAEEEIRAALQIYEAAYGDHLHTATTLVHLASVTLDQGRFREAAGYAGASRTMMWRLMFTDRPASLDARARGFADRAHRLWFDEARAAADQTGMREAALSRVAYAGGGQPGLLRDTELWEFLRELLIGIRLEGEMEHYHDTSFLAALAMELWPMAGYRDPDIMREAVSGLAHDLYDRRQVDLALDLFRLNFEFAVENLSQRPLSLAAALEEYALALLGAGRLEEAGELLGSNYDSLHQQLDASDQANLTIVMASWLCLTGQGGRAWQMSEELEAGWHAGVVSASGMELFLSRRAPVAICAGRYEEGYSDLLRARELSASYPGSRGENYYSAGLGIIAFRHLNRPAEALEHLRIASDGQTQRFRARQTIGGGLNDESLTATDYSLFIVRTEAVWGAAHAREP